MIFRKPVMNSLHFLKLWEVAGLIFRTKSIIAPRLWDAANFIVR